MYINSLQAIDIAISAIQQLPNSDVNEQAITRLNNMKQDRYINWTKEMVFQYLDNWKETHGRNPTVTNLTEPNMPKATTIQRLFDMRASAFLNIYYSNNQKKRNSTKYTNKTKQEWIDDFKQQFNEIQPKSSKEYNAKRNQNSPTWLTIARYLNVATWKELLELTDVDKKCLYNQYQFRPKIMSYTVNSTSSLYEKLEKLLNKQE